ncbi:MAG: murein transglycosylase A, partial [Allosphingosinicella sp.]
MARESLSLRSALLAAMLVALGSCARQLSPPEPPQPVIEPPPPPATARAAGIRAGPPLRHLDADEARDAYRAFLISCPSLINRDDPSGLTRRDDWVPLCSAQSSDPVRFMRTAFEAIEVGDGAAHATGYYEPEISGCRVRQPGCAVPIYAPPPDLLEVNPLTAERGRGRLDESGAFVPYHDRAAIEDGALAGQGLEIAWAADPVELFFLQIQGSGRVRMADGSVMRIGYASQNGREYVAIGRLLRDRGILTSPITMQAITEWLRSHPADGREVMRENKSYIFFRELTGPGPLGALGLPVTPRATVAADPKFVPLGAPVLLTGMDNPAANGLWIAQDTGGAIKGANRFDTFWGAGSEAAS